MQGLKHAVLGHGVGLAWAMQVLSCAQSIMWQLCAVMSAPRPTHTLPALPAGTSVASPVVAGAVCLLASTVPEAVRWSVLNPASMKQVRTTNVRMCPGGLQGMRVEQWTGRLKVFLGACGHSYWWNSTGLACTICLCAASLQAANICTCTAEPPTPMCTQRMAKLTRH